MVNRLVVLLSTLLLASCSGNRVFEQNESLPNAVWQVNDIKSFSFQVPDTTRQYNVLFNIRSSADYDYQNLFFSYMLKNASGTVLDSALVEENLFDPITGKPLGQGFGNYSDLQIPIITNTRFTDTGSYQLNLQQFMRTESLAGVVSVGARVEVVAP